MVLNIIDFVLTAASENLLPLLKLRKFTSQNFNYNFTIQKKPI